MASKSSTCTDGHQRTSIASFAARNQRTCRCRYLNAVCALVAWWAAEGREIDRARRALRLQRMNVSDREDPLAAVIRCTADPAKADMRYAAVYKSDSEPLDQFIRRKGGINACAGRVPRRGSNRSLFAAPIPAGKRFGEARDHAGIFGDELPIPRDRDSPLPWFPRQSPGKSTGARKPDLRGTAWWGW
jgi:hypothetical protein